MALLGAQMVITLIMVSVFQKLGTFFSLARWLLCSTGLVRYLYPTDSELRQLAGIPKISKEKSKGKKGSKSDHGDIFRIPRSLDVPLESTKVTPLDVVHLRFYSEYQWVVDFALYAGLVYHSFYPIKDEVNLSTVWCMLVLGKVLVSLTVQYFKGEQSVGERSTVIVAAFAYLVIAMMIMVVDERNLESGLETAYQSFNSSAARFLGSQGLQSSGPASKLVLKFFLALWCGFIGGIFIFPGFRAARMHYDLLKYYEANRIKRFLLNVSFASPFLLVLLWVKPVCRDYLTVRVFSGMSAPLMTDSAFDSMRLVAVVVVALHRLFLMPIYLQAYLNMAYQRVQEQKKEAGRITNRELQEKIASVFFYLCVVTLQYVIPIFCCLFFAFLFKALGGLTWDGVQVPLESPALFYSSPSTTDDAATIMQSARQFTLALDSLKQVFTVEVSRGVLGFALWWSTFAWFSSSFLGMLYQTYFKHS
ncbi:Transmembrane protein 161B [Frankliniella fusca]|uniref:Transmembrane protein 161B n=1 Tax=Frankliniella fusca TaxID=407009 RepID=A0AAE1GSM3_9NEOP|nr:Transmembrane protein 161B [Frankliniella fusca]